MSYGFRIQFVCCVFAVVLCLVSAKWHKMCTMNAANYTRYTIYIAHTATSTNATSQPVNQSATHTQMHSRIKRDGLGVFRFIVLNFISFWRQLVCVVALLLVSLNVQLFVFLLLGVFFLILFFSSDQIDGIHRICNKIIHFFHIFFSRSSLSLSSTPFIHSHSICFCVYCNKK